MSPKYGFKREDITTQEEIQTSLDKTTIPLLRAILVFLYLYGARITEVLNLKRKRIRWDPKYIYAEVGVLKRRDSAVGPYKMVPHILRVHRKAPFIGILLEYLEGIQDGERLVFPVSRQWVHTKFKILNPFLSPHVLRHDRLFKLALAGASEYELMDWAGWSDTRPAGSYIRATGRLASKLSDLVY